VLPDHILKHPDDLIAKLDLRTEAVVPGQPLERIPHNTADVLRQCHVAVPGVKRFRFNLDLVPAQGG
jgi:hypothetical protein